MNDSHYDGKSICVRISIHLLSIAANILFDNNGGVKLADFGVAAALTSKDQLRNTFVGTPVRTAIYSGRRVQQINFHHFYDTAIHGARDYIINGL